ncbi:HalOD1 output domain-containing protein [Natronosalvus caseinilyticus]|uniref:HalOD1 output domain-containing protein n=1 Tax=Natronosalvus caseinilyticus TaxID=2953747 RepID=UPI0028B196D0|nr:HalOD1 output domain-containing protein [Natronosalvus caseinilyticus]
MSENECNEDASTDLKSFLRQDRAGYDPKTESYYAQYDVENSETLVTTVVRSVAAITGKTPVELDPLYTTIDPDALKQVLDNSRSDSTKQGSVSITFDFASCEITISCDGTMRIEPPDDAPPHRK